MRRSTLSNSQLDYVQVTNVSDRNAVCITPYNAEITVSWRLNLPSPLPEVGDWWVVERTDATDWTFVSRMTSGTYNAMFYSVTLDMATCVGREREVVDDIKKMGVSGVYLTVLSNGIAYWESGWAPKLGYSTVGGSLQQVIERLNYYNINVTLVLDCNSIQPDANNAQYCQTAEYLKVAGGSVIGDPVAKISYPATRYIMSEIVYELYANYGDIATGVFFSNFGIHEPHDYSESATTGTLDVNWIYDASQATKTSFMSKYQHRPDYRVLTNKTASNWRSAWDEWQEFWNSEYVDYIAALRAMPIGNWPISAMVPANTILRASSLQRTGRYTSCIDDEFSELGWSYVCVPLDYTYQQDEAAELRSLEYAVAAAKRFCQSASAVYQLDVSHIYQPDGVFSILAKYEATNIVLDSYEKWCLLSDDEVIHIKEAMNAYSVTEKSTLDEVGIAISSRARDVDYPSVQMNHEWFNALEKFSAALLDNLPHKLRILYDEDLDTSSNLDGLAAIAFYNQSRLSDTAITAIGELFNDAGIELVFVGVAKDNDGQLTLLDKFTQGANTYGLYSGFLTVTNDSFSVFTKRYWLGDDDAVLGINPAITNKHATANRLLLNKEQVAPVFFKGRSSYVGFDVTASDTLLYLSSELVLYAIGRNGANNENA